MEQLVQRLQAIKEEIIQLKRVNEDLKKADEKKDKEIHRLKQLIDIQNSSLKQLEQKLKIKRIADEVSSDDVENSNNRDLKFKINEMIREVDKIISLIHQ